MTEPTIRAMLVASYAAARKSGAVAMVPASLAGAVVASSRNTADGFALVERVRELLRAMATEEGESVPARASATSPLAKCEAS